MRSRTSLLDEALRATDPLADGDAEQGAAAAEELLASIVASDPGAGAPGGPRRARQAPARTGRRRLFLAVPVAAALLAALVVGLPGGGEDGRGTLPALTEAAEAAAAQAPLAEDLPYLYMKTRYTGVTTAVAGGRGWSVYAPSIREQWIAEDGSGLVRTVDGPPRWVDPADREAWRASGLPPFVTWGREVSEEDVPAGRFRNFVPGGVSLAELPTDASGLAAWLERRVLDPKAGAGAGNGFSVAVKTLTLVAEILSNPLAPPTLRAALYEAEGRIPGIEYLGAVKDQLGRRGVAVGAESANSGAPTVYSLIFDPRTSRVLATQEEILEAPSALPDVGYPMTESTLYLASGAASSPGGKPQLWSPAPR